jgi:hypothetical protein
MRRRDVLRLGAFGPALLALSNLPLSALAALPPGESREHLLDDDQGDLLLAVMERMVDTGLPDAPSVREVGALATAERVLAALDPSLASQLVLALRLVDWWPALVELRFARFRSLPPEARDESLEGWRSSSLALRRRVFYALRNLSLLCYWSRDPTWKLIGYGGPWLGRRG